MPTKASKFKKVIKQVLTPQLQELGYVNTSPLSWAKDSSTTEPYIFSIQITPYFNQGEEGYCYLEAGAHLAFIPPAHLEGKNPKDEVIETIDSMFRKRLTNKLNDRDDFICGNDEEGMQLMTDYLFEAVKHEAAGYFTSFDPKSFPAPFMSITTEDINQKVAHTTLFVEPTIMIALHLSRIHLYLQDQHKANEFANYGLSLVEGKRGSGLIPHFENIKKGNLYFS